MTAPTTRSVAWATLVQYGVLLFFFALMLFAANPFRAQSGTIPLDGAGPNPLLQNHPLVAIHPPFLYAGYVGFAIPFSFAVAALVTGRFGEGWLAAVRRTTLVSWGFLTVGHRARARGGATRCSAGAGSGAGTRSRTRRCCRGSRPPPSSIP